MSAVEIMKLLECANKFFAAGDAQNVVASLSGARILSMNDVCSIDSLTGDPASPVVGVRALVIAARNKFCTDCGKVPPGDVQRCVNFAKLAVKASELQVDEDAKAIVASHKSKGETDFTDDVKVGASCWKKFAQVYPNNHVPTNMRLPAKLVTGIHRAFVKGEACEVWWRVNDQKTAHGSSRVTDEQSVSTLEKGQELVLKSTDIGEERHKAGEHIEFSQCVCYSIAAAVTFEISKGEKKNGSRGKLVGRAGLLYGTLPACERVHAAILAHSKNVEYQSYMPYITLRIWKRIVELVTIGDGTYFGKRGCTGLHFDMCCDRVIADSSYWKPEEKDVREIEVRSKKRKADADKARDTGKGGGQWAKGGKGQGGLGFPSKKNTNVVQKACFDFQNTGRCWKRLDKGLPCNFEHVPRQGGFGTTNGPPVGNMPPAQANMQMLPPPLPPGFVPVPAGPPPMMLGYNPKGGKG